DPVRPGADLVRCFAARGAVAEDQPAGSRLVDLLRRDPLVLTVVPLHEVRLDHGVAPEPHQLAGLARPTEGTRENEREGHLGQNGLETAGHCSPIVGEWKVRHAGVLPAQAPRGLSVADDIDPLLSAGHAQSFRALGRPWSLRTPDRCQKSAAVSGPERGPAFTSAPPQRHSRISRMSSPCFAMYCVCSISLSRTACLA